MFVILITPTNISHKPSHRVLTGIIGMVTPSDDRRDLILVVLHQFAIPFAS